MRHSPLILGAFLCGCGGNVVASEHAKLAALTVPAEAGVTVTDVVLEILEVRDAGDEKSHKVSTLGFTVEGAPLRTFTPGYKYACRFGDVVLTDGFVEWGNDAVDDRVRPEIGMIGADQYSKTTGAGEPSACEFTLRLRERGPLRAPPAEMQSKPLGVLCHVKGQSALTDGACPDGAIARDPRPASLISARLGGLKPITMQPGNRQGVLLGSVLTLHRPLPDGPFAVRFRTTCDGVDGNIGMGTQHFTDVAPGESIWFTASLGSNEQGPGPKRCDIAVVVEAEGATTEVARSCYENGALRDGACA